VPLSLEGGTAGSLMRCGFCGGAVASQRCAVARLRSIALRALAGCPLVIQLLDLVIGSKRRHPLRAYPGPARVPTGVAGPEPVDHLPHAALVGRRTGLLAAVRGLRLTVVLSRNAVARTRRWRGEQSPRCSQEPCRSRRARRRRTIGCGAGARDARSGPHARRRLCWQDSPLFLPRVTASTRACRLNGATSRQFPGVGQRPTHGTGSTCSARRMSMVPAEVITHAAPVYPAVLGALIPSAWHHVERWTNISIESDHASSNTVCDRCAAYAPTAPPRQSLPATPSCRTCAAATTSWQSTRHRRCGSARRSTNSPRNLTPLFGRPPCPRVPRTQRAPAGP
jgi:hypothetical protein